MPDDLYRRLQVLLQNRSGLHFPPEQQSDLERGVRNAMLAADFHDLALYYHCLEKTSQSDPLWKHLVEQLTIGETYFFHNQPHFQTLRENLLPAIIDKRRQQGLRMLRIWSAGASTGEEPYSIAILLRELLPDIDEWNIHLLATDINDAALNRGREGIYGEWSFRNESPLSMRELYFSPRGGRYEIDPVLRRMVRFEYLNLVENAYPSAASDTINMDIIICRNVTIYFDRSTTRQIIDRFYQSLVDGGWLIVGHSEPLASIYADYETYNFNNAVFYRKPVGESVKRERVSTQEWIALSLDYAAMAEQPTNQQQTLQIDDVYDLIAAGKFEEARLRLNEFLELMPDHVEALFLLAKLLADEGRFDAVHSLLDTIEELDPLVPQAHFLRALLHQQDAATVDAKAALRRALYADRDFVLAHYHMGELLYAEGNAEMAKRSWEYALKILGKHDRDTAVPFGDGTMVGTLIHAIEQRLRRL